MHPFWLSTANNFISKPFRSLIGKAARFANPLRTFIAKDQMGVRAENVWAPCCTTIVTATKTAFFWNAIGTGCCSNRQVLILR